MKILNFGSCNIDYVYKLSRIVSPGETADSYSLDKFPGGKGLNQSIAIARSGRQIFHAGCIGKDGYFLKEILDRSNVDTRYLKMQESVPTGHAIIQVDKSGENCIILYRGTNYMIDEAYIDTVLGDFNEGDMILLQNEISNIDYIISKAYDRKMTIVMNPSPLTQSLREIDFRKISILILNEIEASELTGWRQPEEIRKYFMSRYPTMKVVLTLGANGSVYMDADQFEYCSAFNVNVKDTTAAGDTFTGYFISGMLRGMKTGKNLAYASAASALAVSEMGAASSIPYREKVEEALRTLKKSRPVDDSVAQKKRKIEAYFEDHLQQANLNGVASVLCYSPEYAITWIKKNYGMSFSELVIRERCRRAAQLLHETELSIGEIIRSCGYENESFFRTKFKEIYGCAPLKYRKNYREGRNEI